MSKKTYELTEELTKLGYKKNKEGDIVSPVITTGKMVMYFGDVLTPYQYNEAQNPRYAITQVIESEAELKRLEDIVETLSKIRFGDVEKDINYSTPIKLVDDKFIEAKKTPETWIDLKGKKVLRSHRADVTKSGKVIGRPNVLVYQGKGQPVVKIKEDAEIESYIYRGANISTSLTFATYKNGKEWGVTAYLNNVLFISHGEKLGGLGGAEFNNLDFGDVEDAGFNPAEDDIDLGVNV